VFIRVIRVIRGPLPLSYNSLMTPDEKLAAILAAVQTDPGNRGLARDPHDNLFTAHPGDFAAACRSIANDEYPNIRVITGFFISTANPPAFETDGPLGAVFLAKAFDALPSRIGVFTENGCRPAVHSGLTASGCSESLAGQIISHPQLGVGLRINRLIVNSHLIALERAGIASDGRTYTMRGRDIGEHTLPTHELLKSASCSIGIGDGGNEIGMGKIPHDTIVKNIPNGDLIHCRVPTDHLIVAGVSNWGAYALAAGVYVLRGATPPADLFDPDREREILEVMVREGPLVDGVTGRQTATVDGLSWDEYSKPLVRIREILSE
jgi:hypothetical protein